MFSKFNEVLAWFVSRSEREDGQALAEYGLLLALIAVVCILALTAPWVWPSQARSAASQALCRSTPSWLRALRLTMSS